MQTIELESEPWLISENNRPNFYNFLVLLQACCILDLPTSRAQSFLFFLFFCFGSAISEGGK